VRKLPTTPGTDKKGVKTVGVARQYTGVTSQVENCQVAPFLVWATPRGAGIIDRRLYTPKTWTGDLARMTAAGVPDDVTFATKPAQVIEMVKATLAAGYRPGWLAADEVYGRNPALRAYLESQQLAYVMGIARTDAINTAAGPIKAVDLAFDARMCWTRLSAGAGAHGQRLYDWALVHIEPAPDQVGHYALLIRRSLKPNPETGKIEHAYYLTYSPTPVRLGVLVKVAGTRWRIEEAFQSGKELTGLDEHQVRTWTSWHRWTALAIAAHSLLTGIVADQPPPPPGYAPDTRQEIRRLLARLCWPVTHTRDHVLAWRRWRRRRRYAAWICHYKRRGQPLPNPDPYVTTDPQPRP
jgi:SRSO17 transposase